MPHYNVNRYAVMENFDILLRFELRGTKKRVLEFLRDNLPFESYNPNGFF